MQFKSDKFFTKRTFAIATILEHCTHLIKNMVSTINIWPFLLFSSTVDLGHLIRFSSIQRILNYFKGHTSSSKWVFLAKTKFGCCLGCEEAIKIVFFPGPLLSKIHHWPGSSPKGPDCAQPVFGGVTEVAKDLSSNSSIAVCCYWWAFKEAEKTSLLWNSVML